MKATRPLLVASAALFWACTRAEDADRVGSDTSRSAESLTHLRVAVSAAVKNRPVQWISPNVLCVPLFDAQDIPSCQSRAVVLHSQSTLDSLSAMLTPSQGTPPFLACLKISREIAVGDSSFIFVGAVGGGTSEGLASSTTIRQWFRRVNGADSSWIDASDIYNTVSAVAPIVVKESCR